MRPGFTLPARTADHTLPIEVSRAATSSCARAEASLRSSGSGIEKR